jgi:hypothetical protein
MIDFTRPDPFRLAFLGDKRDLQIKVGIARMKKILDHDRRYISALGDIGLLEQASFETVREFCIHAEALKGFYDDLVENVQIAMDSLEAMDHRRTA